MLISMNSHLVCLILVGNFMTSIEASASSNHSLLMMAEGFEMTLKCSTHSFEQEIGISGSSCVFGLSTLW
jgi:hypothetical protein